MVVLGQTQTRAAVLSPGTGTKTWSGLVEEQVGLWERRIYVDPNERSRDLSTSVRGNRFVWCHGGLGVLFHVRVLGIKERRSKREGRRTKEAKLSWRIQCPFCPSASVPTLAPVPLIPFPRSRNFRPTARESSDCNGGLRCICDEFGLGPDQE